MSCGLWLSEIRRLLIGSAWGVARRSTNLTINENEFGEQGFYGVVIRKAVCRFHCSFLSLVLY